jgi:hypothetical protein
MSAPQELAKAARLILSDALQALQSSPDVPAPLLTMAEPIARAMGILHAIEASGGTRLEGREEVLASVRGVLDSLQQVEVNHPAVDQATEAVASSLTKLFALARAAAPAGAKPAAAAPAPVATTVMAGTPAAVVPPAAPAAYGQPAVPAETPPPPMPAATPTPFMPGLAPAPAPTQALPASPPQGFAPTAAMPADPDAARVMAEVEAAKRVLAEAEARAAEEALRAAEARRLAEAKAAEAARQAAEAQRRVQEQASREAKALKPVPGMEGAKLPAAGVARMNVELGAHSPSNFYKGLAGSDVVDHGGIFVATYKLPKVGTAVALRVLLPGELEFEADAVVQWTRETRSGDEQPGFGAKFARMSGEGRQLVYRYARNREPIFYDDF